MPADWQDFEAGFLDLIQPAKLVAKVVDRWSITQERNVYWHGFSDDRGDARLRLLFDTFARRASIAAGTPNGANAIEGWLNLLRDESPHFQSINVAGAENCGMIPDLALASAEYCHVRVTGIGSAGGLNGYRTRGK